MSVVVSRSTSEQLTRVMRFFGIDECNRPLFGRAAESCGVDVMSSVIGALDAVIQMDPRCGAESRIRAIIERDQRSRRGR